MDVCIPIRMANKHKTLCCHCARRWGRLAGRGTETRHAFISLELESEQFLSVLLVHTGWTEVQDIQVKVWLSLPACAAHTQRGCVQILRRTFPQSRHWLTVDLNNTNDHVLFSTRRMPQHSFNVTVFLSRPAPFLSHSALLVMCFVVMNY